MNWRIGSMGERRIAVLTGAAGGLGVAASRALGKAGIKVVMTDIAPNRAEAAAANLRSEGIEAIGSALDVADWGAVHEFFGRVAKDHLRLDILVNLAGVVQNDYLAKVRD